MTFKDEMIAAIERGECTDEGAYDYVRESMADAADRRKDEAKENACVDPMGPETDRGGLIGQQPY